MANYVLTYSGGSMPETQQEVDVVMAAWGAWFEAMGSAVVDGGAPTGAVKTVSGDGSVSDGGTSGLSGYSIIVAPSHDEAVAHAKGCPILAGGGAVEVHETIEM